MERTRRKLLYTAAAAVAAPFVPGFVQGQPRVPGTAEPGAGGDRVLEAILQLQTRGLKMTSHGVPSAEGIRAQAAAVRMFAAHAPATGIDVEMRRQAAHERARRRAGRPPRRVEEEDVRALLQQRGIDEAHLVLPVPDAAGEAQALAMLAEGDLAETLTAIASAMEDLAAEVDKRGGLVRLVQEPFHQSPEAVYCQSLIASHLTTGAATAIACALPPNLVCPFLAGVYAGLTLMILYHGCY